MVHSTNYETVSTFVKVMQKKTVAFFFSTRCSYAIFIGGADVLYNKFNIAASWHPPVNPPYHTNSTYKCVVDRGGSYWRLSRCTERHHVVCQG